MNWKMDRSFEFVFLFLVAPAFTIPALILHKKGFSIGEPLLFLIGGVIWFVLGFFHWTAENTVSDDLYATLWKANPENVRQIRRVFSVPIMGIGILLTLVSLTDLIGWLFL